MPGMQYIWSVDEMPGLKASTGNLRVYSNSDARIDCAMRPGRDHNYMLTVVLSFSMAGHMGVPCFILPSKTGSITIDADIPGKYSYVTFAVTENAYITTRIFVEYCKTLRQLVGHSLPLLLISDGHSSRTQAPVVAYLASINIHLFLLPSNTSHALSPNDQWHQRLNGRRHTIGIQQQTPAETRVRNQAEEFRVLLKAVDSLIFDHKMLQAAFSHAGIASTERSVEKMLNRPPSAPSAKRTQSAGSQISLSTPEQPPAPDFALIDDLDVALASIAALQAANEATVTKLRRARTRLEETQATADFRVQQAKTAARLEIVDEKRQSRVSLPINGLLGMGEALELLLERQKKREQTALGQRKASRRLEREAPLRDALGLGETERLTTKAMAQYLKDNGAPCAAKARPQLLLALAEHLDVELAPAESVVGAAAEEEEEAAMDSEDEGDDIAVVQVRPGCSKRSFTSIIFDDA